MLYIILYVQKSLIIDKSNILGIMISLVHVYVLSLYTVYWTFTGTCGFEQMWPRVYLRRQTTVRRQNKEEKNVRKKRSHQTRKLQKIRLSQTDGGRMALSLTAKTFLLLWLRKWGHSHETRNHWVHPIKSIGLIAPGWEAHFWRIFHWTLINWKDQVIMDVITTTVPDTTKLLYCFFPVPSIVNSYCYRHLANYVYL